MRQNLTFLLKSALIFTISFLSIGAIAQTKTSKKSGNWSSAGTWIPSGVPTATDNVMITNGHKVRIDGDFAVNSLTIGTTSTAKSTIEFKGNTAHSFTVFGDVLISTADTFDIKANSNTTHTVSFFGDIVNNGGIQFNADANSRVISRFLKNGNQSISGSSSFSKFYNMELNMGNSASNILEVSVSNFSVPANFLTLNNGTFKISTTNAQNITTFTTSTNIPSTAGLWLNSGNVLVNCSNNLSFSGPLTISSGTLAVAGNFSNNGTFIHSAGLVLLNGSTLQQIGGTNISNLYSLQLNNTSGAKLTQAATLINELIISNGTFNTNSNAFTLLSSAANTARIAQITGSGDISGNVTVQRFAPGGTTGWALLGAPISSGLTLNDWDDDIYISCPTCPDGSASNFLSIYTYDETAAGSYSDVSSYIPLSTINDPILPDKGYWVYLGNSQYTTNDIVIDVTGSVRKFNQTIPLNYTPNSGANDIGWNLIPNPYPSPISWTALKGSTSNIDDAIYVYNTDLNGGAGDHATYVNGVSSPAVVSGGVGDVIPMCQAFYVHSTGATQLNASESVKTSGNPTFLRTSQQGDKELIRLTLSGSNNRSTETVIYTQTGASENLDNQFDAIKLVSQNPLAPSIASEMDNTLFQINAIPEVNGTFTTNIRALTGTSGNYKLVLSEWNSFPEGTCFDLYDKFLNTHTNLKNTSYIFNLSDTTTTSRFVLSITLNHLQVNTQIKQPTCKNIFEGEFTITGNNSGPWNYYWKDQNNNVIRTQLNKSSADTLNYLMNGNYKVAVTTVGQCDHNETEFSIIPQLHTLAEFVAPDSSYLSDNTPVLFLNKTVYHTSTVWDFGDNSSLSYEYSPSHQYSAMGDYHVSMVATSPTGCIDTIVKDIVILQKPVGIKESILNYNKFVLKTNTQNRYTIEQELPYGSMLDYKLVDVTGKELLNKSVTSTGLIKLDINLDSYSSGIYLLTLKYPDEAIRTIKLTSN